MKIHLLRWLSPFLLLVLFATPTLAQDPVAFPGNDLDALSEDVDLQTSRAIRNVGTLANEPFSASKSLLPDFDARALAWIAAVLILALVARVRPIMTMRNVDAIVLASSCLVLLLRDDQSYLSDGPTSASMQWYGYLATTAIAGYWFIRGMMLLLAKAPKPIHANMAEGGLVVLAVAGLAMAITTINSAPLSDGARDGYLGGLVTEQAERLPYGDLEADNRAPLLYLTFAAVDQFAPSSIQDEEGTPIEMHWNNQPEWALQNWETDADLLTVRVVNSLLFVLLFAAVTLTGQRLHSIAFGLTLGAVLCFYPGFVECFHHPEITLPAALLAWTVAFATIPGIGGLLAMPTAILASMSWGWALLTVPVLLGYFFGKRWNGFGAAFGTIAGVSGAVAILLYLVAPSLPRPDGSMQLAGWQPAHKASLSEDGVLLVEDYGVDEGLEPQLQSSLWRYLLKESVTLETADMQIALPPDTPAGSVHYQRLASSEDAHPALLTAYRSEMGKQPPLSQLRAATRTVLEATWKPRPRTQLLEGRTSTWGLWEAAADLEPDRWTQIRRTSKIVVGLIAIAIGAILLRLQDVQLHQLLGGLLALAAAALIISATGAVSNLVLLAPFVLASLSAGGQPVDVPSGTGPRTTG